MSAVDWHQILVANGNRELVSSGGVSKHGGIGVCGATCFDIGLVDEDLTPHSVISTVNAGYMMGDSISVRIVCVRRLSAGDLTLPRGWALSS